jgi:hypothetical protein
MTKRIEDQILENIVAMVSEHKKSAKITKQGILNALEEAAKALQAGQAPQDIAADLKRLAKDVRNGSK